MNKYETLVGRKPIQRLLADNPDHPKYPLHKRRFYNFPEAGTVTTSRLEEYGQEHKMLESRQERTSNHREKTKGKLTLSEIMKLELHLTNVRRRQILDERRAKCDIIQSRLMEGAQRPAPENSIRVCDKHAAYFMLFGVLAHLDQITQASRQAVYH